MGNVIYLSSPHMGSQEMEFINTAFACNGIGSLGPNVNGFEQDLCDYSKIGHCAVLSSGTAAIHLALIILGIKEGDEVLASTFTFSATINPIVYQGAIPILVESEPDTWNMSPVHLRSAIEDRIAKGKKPKAIIPVHLYGMPAKMEEIMAIAKAYDIPVIEDAAEGLGASFKGMKLGTFGSMGVYSFNGNKIITTSGGGALVSEDRKHIERARFLATQARDNAPHYEHTQIGYNYRMSNISAGIGRGQMLVLDKWVALRREVYENYKKELSELPIQFLEEPSQDFFSNRWLTTVLTPSYEKREEIRLALEKKNIESRPLWKPMHVQPVFKQYPYYGDGLSERLFERGLCLPSGSNMTFEEQKSVIEVIKNCF